MPDVLLPEGEGHAVVETAGHEGVANVAQVVEQEKDLGFDLGILRS